MSKQAWEIIKANREALEQGRALLVSLVDAEYTKVCEPWMSSSIGQHIRHVTDMYLALIESVESEGEATVDYDYRRRGSQVEQSCAKGAEAMQRVVLWLDALDPALVTQKILSIKSEVSLQTSTSVTLQSSLMRELVFVGSHTVHHYALIKVIANYQGLHVAAGFGIAPATASFLRNEVECVQ